MPGDLYAQVPFVFPTPEWELMREDQPGTGLWRLWREGDVAGGPRPFERVAVDRRSVYAMVHPEIPACHIDKLIPPPERKRPPFSDDAVFTLFHCVERRDIRTIWDEMLAHPERNKRFGILGEVSLPNGKIVELAVSWRRSQQIFAKHLAALTRVASPLQNLGGECDALEIILGMYGQYLSEGQEVA